MKTNFSRGGAASAVLLALAATATAFYFHGHDATPRPKTVSAVRAMPVADAVQKPAPNPTPVSTATAFAASGITPLPTDATSVPDEDLLKLSGLVDLANARYQHPDKARWAQAIPVAQNLLSGPCDCEQRNWLNHFVEMGNDALSNSNDSYYEHANLMVTLGRNDKDAMAMSHHPN